MSDGSNSAGRLRSFVERIQRLDEEISGLNADKKDIFAEAKSDGFDVPALKKVLSILRKDPQARAEQEAIVATYLANLGEIDAASEVESSLVQVQARAVTPDWAAVKAAVKGSEH